MQASVQRVGSSLVHRCGIADFSPVGGAVEQDVLSRMEIFPFSKKEIVCFG